MNPLSSLRTGRQLGVLLALTVFGMVCKAGAAEARWWKGNLHTHSLWSDGDDFPESIAIAASFSQSVTPMSSGLPDEPEEHDRNHGRRQGSKQESDRADAGFLERLGILEDAGSGGIGRVGDHR